MCKRCRAAKHRLKFQVSKPLKSEISKHENELQNKILVFGNQSMGRREQWASGTREGYGHCPIRPFIYAFNNPYAHCFIRPLLHTPSHRLLIALYVHCPICPLTHMLIAPRRLLHKPIDRYVHCLIHLIRQLPHFSVVSYAHCPIALCPIRPLRHLPTAPCALCSIRLLQGWL